MLIPPDLVPAAFRDRVAANLEDARARINEILSDKAGKPMTDISQVMPNDGTVACPIADCGWTTTKGLQGLSVHLGARHRDVPVSQRRAYCGLPPIAPSQKRKPETDEERIARLERESAANNGHVDLVNHPPHYTYGKIEVIEVLEDWQLGFHEANAVKYIARAKHKGSERQDLEKAVWYLNRRIAQLADAD